MRAGLAAWLPLALVACGAATRSTPPPPALALIGPGTGAVRFAAIDPLSLAVLPGPAVAIAEYHAARAFSRDARRLAVGLSAPGSGPRIGLQILDVAGRRVLRSVPTGIAAEAVAWVSGTRVAALLQSGEVVIVDADAGTIVARRRFPAPSGCGQPPVALAGERAVFLLTGAGRARAARVVLAGADGSIRAVALRGVRVGSSVAGCTGSGLAVDPAAGRAYVVAPGAPIAEVRLASMRVRKHRVAGVPGGRAVAVAARRCRAHGAICSSRRSALWLGNGRLAVSGLDMVATGAGAATAPRPAGLTIVDTRRWVARGLDRRAGAARRAGRLVLTFGGGEPDPAHPHGGGVRAYAPAGGRPVWRRDRDQVWDLELAGGRAYARGLRRTFVLDPATGRLLAQPRFASARTLDPLG